MVVRRKYVDVNVFVYWLGRHPVYGKRSYGWIKKIEKAAPREYVTSSLSIYETIVILAGLTGQSLKNAKFVRGIINAFMGLKGLKVEQLKKDDIIQAVRLMDMYGLDYEDSLHLAVALRSESTTAISNDRDWDKTPISKEF